MKSSFARIASIMLCLIAFVSASFATTKPLSYPRGLAVDAKGNLYVANSGGNDILVYSPSYGQMTSKTITQNVSNPTGVAFDTLGNLWVANYGGGGSITEYTGGKQNSANTITNGILGPNAIAIDGLGNIWVENDYINVTVYGSNNGFAPPTTLLRTLTPAAPIYGIALVNGTFSWGGNSVVSFDAATPALMSGALCCVYGPGTGFALAGDAHGNFYQGNLDGSVDYAVPGITSSFLQLSFTPSGIAVDSVRGRLYISNQNGNSISVYSTAGALLKTIQ